MQPLLWLRAGWRPLYWRRRCLSGTIMPALVECGILLGLVEFGGREKWGKTRQRERESKVEKKAWIFNGFLLVYS